MCGENQCVLRNARFLESTIKKKPQSVACNLVKEGVARYERRTACGIANENEADLLTKPLPSGEKRKNFVGRVLHHFFRIEERRSVEK